MAANDEETEHAMKPRNAVTTDTMLKNMASTPEIEHGMGVHVPSMKSKIAPLSALLCAIRHLKAVKSKGDTIKNVPALADVKLNSSNISAALVSSSIQGRRRSSVAPRKVNDIEDNSLVGSTQANSRPTSPGLATCNSEMDAFLFRASKCTIKLP